MIYLTVNDLSVPVFDNELKPDRIALYIIVQQILLYSHQLKELDTSILVTLSLGFFRAFLSKFQIGLQNNSDFFSNFYIIFPPARD